MVHCFKALQSERVSWIISLYSLPVGFCCSSKLSQKRNLWSEFIENLSFIITSFVTAHINRVRRERRILIGFQQQPTDHQYKHMNLNDSLKKEIKIG